MSRRGNVHDNAAMESWNSTFKIECGEKFATNAVAVSLNSSGALRAGSARERSSDASIVEPLHYA